MEERGALKGSKNKEENNYNCTDVNDDVEYSCTHPTSKSVHQSNIYTNTYIYIYIYLDA